MASKEAERIRRMWSEVCDESVSPLLSARLADQLSDERLPSARLDHKAGVMAAALAAAANRRTSQVVGAGHERVFRQLLDQGTKHVGTWRLLDAVRPHLALLSWSYWMTAAILFVLSVFFFPHVAGWGPGVLIVTVPMIALISLIYTVRAGSQGVREWERSCPMTPFQIALARTTLVLGITVIVAFVASLIFVRQEIGVSLAALTISWFAPLLLIVGVYMACDLVLGGMAGPVGAAVIWFVHVAITEAGKRLSSVTTHDYSGGTSGFSAELSGGLNSGLNSGLNGEFTAWVGGKFSSYDVLILAMGASLLAIGLFLTFKGVETTRADRSA